MAAVASKLQTLEWLPTQEARRENFEIQLAPTAGDDSPNSQNLRVPASSWGLDVPELGDWIALGPDEDDTQGEHDELTDHEEVQQIARSFVGNADSHDQETDWDLPEGEPEHAEYLRYPVDP